MLCSDLICHMCRDFRPSRRQLLPVRAARHRQVHLAARPVSGCGLDRSARCGSRTTLLHETRTAEGVHRGPCRPGDDRHRRDPARPPTPPVGSSAHRERQVDPVRPDRLQRQEAAPFGGGPAGGPGRAVRDASLHGRGAGRRLRSRAQPRVGPGASSADGGESGPDATRLHRSVSAAGGQGGGAGAAPRRLQPVPRGRVLLARAVAERLGHRAGMRYPVVGSAGRPVGDRYTVGSW